MKAQQIAPWVLVAILGALLGWSWLPARAANAVIAGPTSAAVGEIVWLDGSASIGQSLEWSATGGQVKQSPVPGLVAFLSPAPGAHTVTLVSQSAAGGRFTRSVATHEITVGDAPLPPDPLPPGPTPPPGPVPAGLAGAARALATQIVPATGRAAQAKIAAEVYRVIAAQIAAGVLPTATEVHSATLSLLRERLGSDYAAWSKWVNSLNVETSKRLNEASPMSDIQRAWDEIATGLEGVI